MDFEDWISSSVGVGRGCMISNNTGHSLLPPASSHACITKQRIKFPPADYITENQ